MSPALYYYLDMWRQFYNFSGRTGVAGFWWAFLVNLPVSLVCALLGLGQVYALLVAVPLLALAIRRLNDAGVSWLWLLALLVPVVGWVVLIVLLLKPGK